MKLKEYITYTFIDNKLDVYEYGRHVIYQPFNSDTGYPFKNVDDALAWLFAHYPDYYTPS